MRTYGQFCSMARALDLVGDRWTLLIVRELLTQGPCRYRDLRDGLPGIATNLLATRLRELEAAGIVARHDLPAPVGASVVELTPRGRDLTGVVRELTRWGAPEMGTYDDEDDAFRTHWLAVPARAFLGDRTPSAPARTVRIGVPPDALDVRADGGTASVAIADPRTDPDAAVDGPPPVLVGLIIGQLSLTAARRAGLTITGPVAAVRRILPPPS